MTIFRCAIEPHCFAPCSPPFSWHGFFQLDPDLPRARESWWTYQPQDCNGDGCQAGQLPGDLARLNWTPVVNGCDGVLNVFEILYSKPHASGTWTPFFTNAVHSIAGCSILNSQFIDIEMGSNCARQRLPH